MKEKIVVKKSYAKLLKVFEKQVIIARIVKLRPASVCNWRKKGIPVKHRQTLVDASNGKIKSVDQLRN